MASTNERYITDSIRRTGRTTHIVIIAAFAVQVLAIVASPSEVPLHWGADGEADSYGSPWLALIAWAIFAGCIVLCELVARNVDVEYWNRPSKIQPDKLESWYSFSMGLLYRANLIVAVLALAMALIYLLQAYQLMFPLVILLVAVLLGYVVIAPAMWKKAN